MHPDIVKKLKLHQKDGVKFMWDSVFESINRIKSDPAGTGCILAHCMGLGKTFQIVALVHTVLCNPDTLVNTVIVVCPRNTLLNWQDEFEDWLSNIQSKKIKVYDIHNEKQVLSILFINIIVL